MDAADHYYDVTVHWDACVLRATSGGGGPGTSTDTGRDVGDKRRNPSLNKDDDDGYPLFLGLDGHNGIDFGGIRKEVVTMHYPFSSSNSARDRDYSYSYFAQCYAGGVLSSSVRWILTPLDCVKCNMQVNPKQFPTVQEGLRFLYQTGGFDTSRGLYKGLAPTAMSYGFQSGTKYGLYEFFKHNLQERPQGQQQKQPGRGWVYAISAAMAEAVGGVFMCPWETAKVRVQTSFPNAAEAVAAVATTSATARATSTAATTATTTTTAQLPVSATSSTVSLRQVMYEMFVLGTVNPYGSLLPLWCRQVPGTVVNFYTYENTAQFLNGMVREYSGNNNSDHRSDDNPHRLAVSLISGYFSGCCAAIATHPADVVLSLRAQQRYKNKSLSDILNNMPGGWQTAFTKGLLPRIFVTGTVIGYQWYVYDCFKAIVINA